MFIKEAREIHGDKYDYSKAIYTSCKAKTEIICWKHGSFWQTPNAHLSHRQGCPACGAGKSLSNARGKALTTKQFIEKAKKIHGDKYSYRKTEYCSGHKKVVITCSRHGDFEQDPYSHLSGCGCPACKAEKISVLRSSSTERFIKRAREKYGEKYDYSQAEYRGNRNKVKVLCRKHGGFWAVPADFISRSRNGGCPLCGESSGENRIRVWLDNNGLSDKYRTEHKFADLKDKDLLRYDFYIPSKNLLVEYNGRQHYKPTMFGTESKLEAENKLKTQRHHDWLKRKYARDHSIRLLVIPFTEFKNIDKILEEALG